MTLSHDQCAFKAGRQIVDASPIANEVVEDIRHHKGQILKLDYEKAYDRVNWVFLDVLYKGLVLDGENK